MDQQPAPGASPETAGARSDTGANAGAVPAEKPAALFTAGQAPTGWPFVERRQSERRHSDRRGGGDRRLDNRREANERRDAERRIIMAPVEDPSFQRDGGGLWPSLDWRPGDRRLDDRRASERRIEDRRSNDRRTSAERRRGDRRKGSLWEGQAALDENIDDLAEAGAYKGGLD